MNSHFKQIGCILTGTLLLTGLSLGLQREFQNPFVAHSTQLSPTPKTLETTESLDINTSAESLFVSPGQSTATTAELIAYAANQNFQLNNASPIDMHYFYASPSNVSSWEEDIFGNSILPAYDSMRITIGDNRETCIYDFRAIFADGSEATAYDINICELSSYTYG